MTNHVTEVLSAAQRRLSATCDRLVDTGMMVVVNGNCDDRGYRYVGPYRNGRLVPVVIHERNGATWCDVGAEIGDELAVDFEQWLAGLPSKLEFVSPPYVAYSSDTGDGIYTRFVWIALATMAPE